MWDFSQVEDSKCSRRISRKSAYWVEKKEGSELGENIGIGGNGKRGRPRQRLLPAALLCRALCCRGEDANLQKQLGGPLTWHGYLLVKMHTKLIGLFYNPLVLLTGVTKFSLRGAQHHLPLGSLGPKLSESWCQVWGQRSSTNS